MSNPNEEQELRNEARTALLKAIKQSAEEIAGHTGSVHSQSLLELSQAYEVLCGKAEPQRKPSQGATS
ncbi:hypothetical protein [Actinomadura hibisca]|uniref:hypothetical protein n=1 Tax=Actinomadura hibisca TaxID=68565 RepID=UPI00082FF8F7|nr:hypothetical protein [Actinomadura hibisca]